MAVTGNRLLDILSEPVQKSILSVARPVDLPARVHLHNPREVPTHLHFLLRGVTSLVVHMSEGGSAEVGMIGREGMVGGEALLGPAPAEVDAVMQISGAALRVPIKAMEALFHEHEELRTRVLQFQQSQINIASQISACNKLHEAEARLSRWLLTASDRSGTEMLGLTQEYLAQMLGSQRTTVALVAGVLQRSGLINYRRGMVEIINREGLTEAACHCYEITRQITELLYP